MTSERMLHVPQLFPLGHMVATPGALAALVAAEEIPHTFLRRHVTGDWGELDPHDVKVNEAGLRDGERLMSVYTLKTGVKVWVITERDRSCTTLLLPEEY